MLSRDKEEIVCALVLHTFYPAAALFTLWRIKNTTKHVTTSPNAFDDKESVKLPHQSNLVDPAKIAAHFERSRAAEEK